MAKMKKKTQSAIDSVARYAEKLGKQLSKRSKKSKGKTAKHAADLASKLVGLQKEAFDATFKVIARVQKRSDQVVKDHVGKSTWMPDEGKEAVHEWSRTLEAGRAEFQETVGKSYDLALAYFERLKKGQPAPKKKAAPKKRAAPKKKTAPKRKATPKKKAAPKRKATPKKTIAKKTTAGKTTPKRKAAPKKRA
ncbi:MAG: hypothetical protein GWP08_20545 [Nitrospiraceae bacterium]|nr:hypothetical protein [Nitrospiraceae bacterium]